MGAHPPSSRVANYDPRWLDALCLSGAVGWGRVSPHPPGPCRRLARSPPRHSHQRCSHHLLRPRVRRLAPSRPRPTICRRGHANRSPQPGGTPHSRASPGARSLLRQRHPTHRQPYSPANAARSVGASHRRTRRRRRLRPAPRLYGSPAAKPPRPTPPASATSAAPPAAGLSFRSRPTTLRVPHPLRFHRKGWALRKPRRSP